jgi:cytochrome c-type biogenesis protein CcmH/NrfG
MAITASSSIRVSPQTRKRVGQLTAALGASSQQEVIQRALDQLEQALFWEGFDEEARAYLAAHPQEEDERASYAGTSGDGMRGRR